MGIGNAAMGVIGSKEARAAAVTAGQKTYQALSQAARSDIAKKGAYPAALGVGGGIGAYGVLTGTGAGLANLGYQDKDDAKKKNSGLILAAIIAVAAVLIIPRLKAAI